MKCLRQKLIRQITIIALIAGLVSVNMAVGELSRLFPGVNVNSLLIEEIKENFKDGSKSNSNADGEFDSLVELDWHVSNIFHLRNSMRMCSKKLSVIALLNFGNVHLDRFTPPPEA